MSHVSSMHFKIQYHGNVYLLTWFVINLEKNGPTTDHDGMRIFYFMNVWAQDGQLDDEGAWLQSPLIEGKDHPFGCFHFWFTFKVNCVLWIENYNFTNHSGVLHSYYFSFHGKIDFRVLTNSASKDRTKWALQKHFGRLQNMTYTQYRKEGGWKVKSRFDHRMETIIGYALL